MRPCKTLAAIAALAAAPACMAAVHAGDIILTLVGGAIVTNQSDIGTGQITPNVRAFRCTFGGVVPDFSTDPGFDCEPGTFPTPGELGFVILDAVRKWNGLNFDEVAEPVISIGFGPATPVYTPTAPWQSVPGFTIAVQPNGEWHRHLEYLIESGAPAVPPGVYLLRMKLTSSVAGESLPFLMVWGENASDGVLDAAVAYARDTLINGRPGDLTGDGVVNSGDLAQLLGAWGSASLSADLTHDGVVGSSDLALLLGNWGG